MGTVHLTPIGSSFTCNYVKKVRTWLADWPTGRTPFIHARLYQTHCRSASRTPSRPLASCSARTPASEGIVCRILETRATALVKDYGPEQEGELTCLDHVGRVQALLVYSTIRLFDYDIRQRCLAEQLPTLYSWSHAMLGRAA
ncbi:uncharacterized protein ATNIH1004_010991 [Aspergillus tanneri]|uniref:Uncharacterized protein n=1 Tax=Aspergillus tanneri TaxID=1220188 RepID=A0A5M9M5Q0_9EURO|nr:uncharacterized protein ATNIH1004_010991 [Aspergillus tanneri]KAA8642051.1 hypothetical protein ATNIH1004_010991 [Aspergillus tanneri]